MQLRGVSILIIDDEEMIVEQMCIFLSTLGYNPTGKTDPQEGLKLLKARRFDVVMVDLQMPAVTGMDIVRALKEQQVDTQIIIITGFATADSAIDALNLGVYGYIRKPYRLEEISAIVSHAVEEQYLRRENIALTANIQKLLGYVTTLNEICSILYQVSDSEMVLNMILDTVTEGMKIRKAALFMHDELYNKFRIIKSTGISPQLIQEMMFKIGQLVNGNEITANAPTILRNINSDLEIDRLHIPRENLQDFILIPIRYLDQVLGFLGVFQITEDDISFNDLVKLLGILATQIAPVFYHMKHSFGELDGKTFSFDRAVYQMISNRIEQAKTARTTVSFAMLKLVLNKHLSGKLPLIDMRNRYGQLVTTEFGASAEVVWQNLDTMIVVMPGCSLASAELTCAQAKRQIERHLSDDENDPNLSLEYMIASYPLDGDSALDLMMRLSNKIFDRIEPALPSANP